MNNLKVTSRGKQKTKLLLGFAIIGILLFGTLVFADTSDLELEMNGLIQELNLNTKKSITLY